VIEAADSQYRVEGHWLEGCRQLEHTARRQRFHGRHDCLEGFVASREQWPDIE
jgi:hypothetical protein